MSYRNAFIKTKNHFFIYIRFIFRIKMKNHTFIYIVYWEEIITTNIIKSNDRRLGYKHVFIAFSYVVICCKFGRDRETALKYIPVLLETEALICTSRLLLCSLLIFSSDSIFANLIDHGINSTYEHFIYRENDKNALPTF